MTVTIVFLNEGTTKTTTIYTVYTGETLLLQVGLLLCYDCMLF